MLATQQKATQFGVTKVLVWKDYVTHAKIFTVDPTFVGRGETENMTHHKTVVPGP